MIDLLLISLILVFIIDLSGIIQSIENGIAKIFKVSPNRVRIPKPFSCSKCLSFWAGLIYLIVTGTFSWVLMGYVCLLAFLTPVFGDILYLVRDVLEIAIRALTPNN